MRVARLAWQATDGDRPGLLVALAADAILSVTTGEEIALGATLLLVMVSTLTFVWASR